MPVFFQLQQVLVKHSPNTVIFGMLDREFIFINKEQTRVKNLIKKVSFESKHTVILVWAFKKKKGDWGEVVSRKMSFNLSLFHEAHILIITSDDNDNLGTVPVAVITQMAISSAYWATHIVFLIMRRSCIRI